jgi:hypothetical protein
MPKDAYFVKCPHCGEEFDERTKECPNCGTWNRKVICRSCGAQINASEKKCPACGARRVKKRSPLEKGLIAAIPIAVIVVAAVLLIPKKAPINTPSSPESASVPAPANTEKDTPDEVSTTTISAEKTPGRTIELTVPADFLDEGTTQESLDAEVSKADGFISAKINADGSATYVMTEERHNDLMTELGQNIDTELANMADSSDYPNIVSVSASNDYTTFTVTLSTDTVGLQESIMVMAFYMYGGMYNAFNGTPADNVSVQFVNQSGTVLESANSRDMQ